MDRLIEFFIGIFRRFEKWDKARFVKESRELLYFINRQVFNQIPSVSAIGGILIGAWVSSTFTTSQIKGTLASLGLIKGASHVVSSAKYRFLSIFLPVLAAGITAFVIQKTLKAYREKQLEMNMAKVAGLGKEIQAELREKLTLLEKAEKAGLLSAGEYETKKANLYQTYSKTPASKIEEFIIKKLTG